MGSSLYPALARIAVDASHGGIESPAATKTETAVAQEVYDSDPSARDVGWPPPGPESARRQLPKSGSLYELVGAVASAGDQVARTSGEEGTTTATKVDQEPLDADPGRFVWR